jgi:protein-disulfide isomerase
MPLSSMRCFRMAALMLASVCLLAAQDWRTATTLPGVDLGGLSAKQEAEALKLLRERACGCACSMTIAQCRFVDPACAYSTGLAQLIVEQIRKGKSEAEVVAAAEASQFAHRAEPKLLDDPITIPIDGAPSIGPAQAPVTLIEFSDFQCPYCSQATPRIEDLLKLYPSSVRLVFKQFPLDFHPHAEMAAEASVAAQKQGKFWQMHDALFANHENLTRDNILFLAQQNGLDLKRFTADMESPAVHEIMARDIHDGDQAGVEGTPTIFINGRKFNGPIDVSVLQPLVDDQLKKLTPAQRAAAQSPLVTTQ